MEDNFARTVQRLILSSDKQELTEAALFYDAASIGLSTQVRVAGDRHGLLDVVELRASF